MDALLVETMRFFLDPVVAKLNDEIDLRSRGYGKNPFHQAAIYLVAFARDLANIPLHSREGIGQARYRARAAYIEREVIPILRFFQENYPIRPEQNKLIEEAVDLLQSACQLGKDGPLRLLDQWYATMKEFHIFVDFSKQAAGKIEQLLAADGQPTGGSSTDSP